METGEVPVAAEEEEEDERKEEDDEFPAPPSLGDLEELAREQQEVPATPRTLRRADSLRQKMAARRIQRTWKHFYQVLLQSSTSCIQAQPILCKIRQKSWKPFFTRSSRRRRLTLTTELKLTL